jgi:Fur family ferric uptake transcriptional regulator
MREFLKTKGFKMTPQRELVFRSFFEAGRHVTVDELYDRVRAKDNSIGYSTVWRNLKLICKVGLAEEVNLGDGITRYDRITPEPHGHLYCLECKKLIEFDVANMVGFLTTVAENQHFAAEGFKIEIQGYCPSCDARRRESLQEHAENK